MISVIIATHKRAELLDVALQHIYQQKDADFEVIVVNDIEEKEEADIIMAKYSSAIYIKDAKIQGPGNKYKAGYKIAKGEYLYMPNDDDYITDDYFFAKCAKILDEDITLSFVSGNASILHEYNDPSRNRITPSPINVVGRIPAMDYIQHFQEQFDKPLSTMSTVFRKTAFESIGIDNIIEFSDSSQYLLALLYGDAYIMKDDVAVYRKNDEKNSLTYNVSINFIINVLKQKEFIFKKLKKQLPSPRNFLANQYRVTYSIAKVSKVSTYNIVRINLWGLIHSHFSYELAKFTIKNIYKAIIKF